MTPKQGLRVTDSPGRESESTESSWKVLQAEEVTCAKPGAAWSFRHWRSMEDCPVAGARGTGREEEQETALEMTVHEGGGISDHLCCK